MTAPDHDIALTSLFFADRDTVARGALAEGVRRAAPRGTARWTAVQWSQLDAAIGEHLAEACPGTFGDVLVQCWRDLRDLREATDPARTPPGTSRSVKLFEHEIEWATYPKLVATLNGARVFDVPLKLALKLEIDLATLTVRDGRIREIGLGQCSGEASVACANAVVIRQPLGDAQLPWRMRFDEGILITRAYPTAGAWR